MAALTKKVLKWGTLVTVVPAATIACGYQLRAVQALENQQDGSRIMRACDLPIYPVAQKLQQEIVPCEKGYFDEQISNVRKTVVDALSGVMKTYEIVEEKTQIGIEHTKASIDLVQSNQDELPRIGVIAGAGMAGLLLGIRGGKIKKLLYTSLAATSAAALVYPEKAMELSELAYTEVKTLWDSVDITGTNVIDENVVDNAPTLMAANDIAEVVDENVKDSWKSTTKKGDPGMSNPEDKDMYSTRTS